MKFISIAWSLIRDEVVALEKDTLKIAKMIVFIIWSNSAFLVC